MGDKYLNKQHPLFIHKTNVCLYNNVLKRKIFLGGYTKDVSFLV